MKRIHLVWHGEYSDRDVLAVFDDEQKLKEYLQEHASPDAYVETRIVNPDPKARAWTITLKRFGGKRGDEFQRWPIRMEAASGNWGKVESIRSDHGHQVYRVAILRGDAQLALEQGKSLIWAKIREEVDRAQGRK